MAATINLTRTIEAIRKSMLYDSVALARRTHDPGAPANWPRMPDPRGMDHAGIDRLIQSIRASDPTHPENWHRNAVQRALQHPRVRDMYFRIKHNLWNWPEFGQMKINARRTIDVVIELARDEAFPW